MLRRSYLAMVRKESVVSDDTLAVARYSKFLQLRELFVLPEYEELDRQISLSASGFYEWIANTGAVSIFALFNFDRLLESLVKLPFVFRLKRVD